MAARGIESDEPFRELLWLYVPDYRLYGKMNSIVSIPKRDGGVFWTASENCSGFKVSD